MKTLALLEQPYSEIAALIGIISFVCGSAGALVLMWLSTKFVKKTAYYHDKAESTADHESLAARMTKIEHDLALSQQPIVTLQRAVEDMKNQLETLTTTIGGLKDSVGTAIHGLDRRTIALEAKRQRSSGG